MSNRSAAPRAFALCVTTTLLVASVARAETYAILPARGDAFPPVLLDVDKQARKALTASGIDVQPPDVTDRLLTELQSSGVSCDVGSDDCALRIGLATGVDVVVAQTVSIVGSRLLLRAAAVSTAADAKPNHVYGELALQDGGVSVGSVVLRAVGKPAKPTPLPLGVTVDPPNALILVDGGGAAAIEDGNLWLTPGAHSIELRATAYKPLTVKLAVAADTLAKNTWKLAPAKAAEPLAPEPTPTAPPTVVDAGLSPALYLVIGGGTVFAIAGLVATITDVHLEGAVSRADRPGETTFGQAALAVAVVGGLAALGGGVWMALE